MHLWGRNFVEVGQERILMILTFWSKLRLLHSTFSYWVWSNHQPSLANLYARWMEDLVQRLILYLWLNRTSGRFVFGYEYLKGNQKSGEFLFHLHLKRIFSNFFQSIILISERTRSRWLAGWIRSFANRAIAFLVGLCLF